MGAAALSSRGSCFVSASLLLVAVLAMGSAPAARAAPCKQCIALTITPPPPQYEFYQFRFFNYNTTRNEMESTVREFAYRAFDEYYQQFLANGTVSPMLTPFANGTITASNTTVGFCGTFASKTDAETFKPFMDLIIQYVYPWQFLCYFLPGYKFSFASRPGSCVSVGNSTACGGIPQPFPNCKCNTAQGTTTLSVSPDITPQPGPSNKTDLYCFKIQGSAPTVQSGCASNVLSKVDFAVDDSSAARKLITRFRVTRNGGSQPTWIKPVWGAQGDRTVRATPLNLPVSAAAGGEVCMEVVKGTLLAELCGGPTCSVSLFNDDKKCCPVYDAAPPPPPLSPFILATPFRPLAL